MDDRSPLRRERERRGWTQDRAAEELQTLGRAHGHLNLGVDGNSVSRWERGKHRPRAPYPDLWAELFGVPVETLWPGSTLPAVAGILSGLTAPGTVDLDMLRRQLLKMMAAATGAAMVPPASQAGAVDDVDAVSAVTGQYRRLDATMPARDLMEPVGSHLLH